MGHRFALDTAGDVDVVVTGPEEVAGRLPVATPAGLVATKLCAVQGRRRASEKRASDAYDLFRLLRDLDADGDVAAVVRAHGGPLAGAVREAAAAILVRGATGLVRNVSSYGAATFAGEMDVDGCPSSASGS